jgi:protein-disulfide isomerase
MKSSLVTALVLALALVAPPAARPQSADDLRALRQEIESLKQGLGAIQRDLQEIKALLAGPRGAAAPGPPPTAVVGLGDSPALGSPTATLTLVEFSDFQCPFCARHVQATFPQLERDYVATGKLRYVVRNFPLESIHPDAFKAAEAAECAGRQGKYWEMHHRLFANQQSLGAAQLPGHAQAVGLDGAAFQRCLAGGEQAEKIRRDVAEGLQAGVNGTPMFFVGVAEGDRMKVLRVIQGAQPYAAFKGTLDGLLAAQPPARK